MLVLLCTQLQSLSFLITNRPLFVHFFLGTLYTPISIYVACNYFHFMWWCRERESVPPSILYYPSLWWWCCRLGCCAVSQLILCLYMYLPIWCSGLSIWILVQSHLPHLHQIFAGSIDGVRNIRIFN